VYARKRVQYEVKGKENASNPRDKGKRKEEAGKAQGRVKRKEEASKTRGCRARGKERRTRVKREWKGGGNVSNARGK
jgi:hypothetical protein